MHAHRSDNTRRHGLAMIMVMIAVGVCAILATAYLSAQSMSAQISDNVTARNRARLIAEGGLSMAVAYVQGNDEWRTEKTEGVWVSGAALAQGNFWITAADGEYVDGVLVGDGDFTDYEMDLVTLTSRGIYRGTTHYVRAVVSPPKRVLMIVDNPDVPTPEDKERYNLLRAWGWRVHVLDSGATAAEFDAALEKMHVIYFPAQTTLQGDVQTALKSTTLPIVSEHLVLAEDVEIGVNKSKEYDATSVKVLPLTQIVTDDAGAESTVVVTHYITQPFPVGILQICDATTTLLRLDGRASGSTSLIRRIDDGSPTCLAVLEAGALGANYQPARARRVVLPWGGVGFNASALNTNGQTLLMRSLDWAGSGWRGFLPGIAVWDDIRIDSSGVIDSYESADGNYDAVRNGADATLSTNSTADDRIKLDGGLIKGSIFLMPKANAYRVIDYHGGAVSGNIYRLSLPVPIPSVTAPTDIPFLGNVTYSTGTTVINSDRRFDDLKITDDATVRIEGDVRIYCQKNLTVEKQGRIVLADGASLTLYTYETAELKDDARINVDPSVDPGGVATIGPALTADPTRLTWILLRDKLVVGGDSHVCAAVQSYNALLEVKDAGQFYGTFVGKEVYVHNAGQLHVDTSSSGTIVTIGGGIDLSLTRVTTQWIDSPIVND